MHYKFLLRLLFFSLLIFLFIDASAQQTPIPDWVKDIGGTGESKLTGIALDQSDNVYVAGNFQGKLTIDHSGVSTPVVLTSVGGYDIFIAKYTPDGKLLWAKSFGGNNLDQVNNIDVDIDGNLILGILYNSASIDCDPGPATANIINAGNEDALIVKFDLNGNYLWARSVGGPSTDRGAVVTSDKLGNVIFVGSFASTSITLGSYTLATLGNLDGFMVKYDKSGNVLWAYGMGSFNDDEIKSVRTTSTDEIVILGKFINTINVNPKLPEVKLTGTGNNAFLAKYGTDGSLIWANKIDGTIDQTVTALDIGPSQDIFITGVYKNTINFNSPGNTISLTSPTNNNIFITKYNSSGTTVWARNIVGTTANPLPYYICVDVDNDVYIGGYFTQQLTFSDGTNNKTINYIGAGAGRNTFFGKFSGASDFLWAFNFGAGCDGNFGHKIAVDSKKNVLLGGAFCKTVDFNTSSCNLLLTAKDPNSDGYISKYNQVKFTGDALITSFKLTDQAAPATINNLAKKITITVKNGTDITKLKPMITTDIGIITPLSEVQRDFTTPQTYVITSNCIDYIWTVEVLIGGIIPEINDCSGEPHTFIGEPNNDPSAIFQWQYINTAVDPNLWVTAPGTSNQANFTFPALQNLGSTDLIFSLRRMVMSSSPTIYDSQFKLVIKPITTNNSISTPQLIFCNGKANVTITGSTPTGALTATSIFKWEKSIDGSNWTIISNQSGKNYIPAEFYQTTYFRRITSTNTCDVYSNAIKIDVFPDVTTANAGVDVDLCNTSVLELNANIATTNETGTWSVISPVGYNAFSASNMNDPKATISNIPENVPVVLRWTIKQQIDCFLESFDEVKIFNYGKPAVSMVSNMTINEGQTLAIPVTITNVPGVTYTYKWTPAAELDDPTKLSPMVSPIETGIYKLTITYGSCSMEREIKIIVDKAKRVDICSGRTMNLQGAVDNDNLSIYRWQQLISGVWTNINGANAADYPLTVANNFTNATIQTEYRRLVINSPYYDSRYLISILASTDNNTISVPEHIFCAASITNLTISGTVPNGASNTNITFAWQQSSDGNTWTAIAGTSKDLSVPSISTTTFYRRTTFANACESYSNTLKITMYPAATLADAGIDQFFCSIRTTSLNANGVANNETGTWTILSPTTYQPFTAQTVHDPKATLLNLPLNEPVVLQWSITNHNCNTITTSNVTINSYKHVIISAPEALTVDLGKSIDLDVTANLEANQTYIFEWKPFLGLNRDDILSPIATPTDDITYTLNIYYGKDCVKSISIKVKVLKEISFPNTFSPNGDGINDVWEIKNFSSYPGSKLFIFNRYGATIFESFTKDGVWDGKFKGKDLTVGTYYYVIRLKDKKNSVYTGEITILN
jgi:gliding motility-associated-like protein